MTKSKEKQIRFRDVQIIPILNIFHKPITQEGRADGNESANLDGYRNILRVRKEFKANKIMPSRPVNISALFSMRHNCSTNEQKQIAIHGYN
ncbi:hypothetical protein HDF19_00680 [Mucilaginibacter sp. E4BP6]|uniref:hypothetical protein n=1 Tax=Mucilaginibacter sp. E4BP6 TaxID=2723089 RepID=UPI0015C9678B|nr:hypothetical protein [Mucilaginibacter sp. E4BP6]NYE66906.1 hypothetical protein [Mucilaginibacter sp. E4BP6]